MDCNPKLLWCSFYYNIYKCDCIERSSRNLSTEKKFINFCPWRHFIYFNTLFYYIICFSLQVNVLYSWSAFNKLGFITLIKWFGGWSRKRKMVMIGYLISCIHRALIQLGSCESHFLCICPVVSLSHCFCLYFPSSKIKLVLKIGS